MFINIYKYLSELLVNYTVQASLLTSLTSFVRDVFESESLLSFEPSRWLRTLLEFALTRNPMRSLYKVEQLRATLERHFDLLTFTSNAPPAFRDLISERRTQYVQSKGIFNKKAQTRYLLKKDNADGAGETNREASCEQQTRWGSSRLGSSSLIPFAHKAPAKTATTTKATTTKKSGKRGEEAEIDELLRDHPTVQQVLEMGFNFRRVRAAVRALMGSAPSARPFPRPEMITNWLIDHEGDDALNDESPTRADDEDDEAAAPSLPFERSSFLPPLGSSTSGRSFGDRVSSRGFFGQLRNDSFGSLLHEHSASHSSDEGTDRVPSAEDEDEEVIHSETQTSDHSSPTIRPFRFARPAPPHSRARQTEQQQSDSEAERDEERYGTPQEEEEPADGSIEEADAKQTTLSFASPEASAPVSPENETLVAGAFSPGTSSFTAAAASSAPTSANRSGGSEVPKVVDTMAPAEGAHELKIGDLVRVKRTVTTPRFKWGAVTASSVGVLKDISFDGDEALVDFAEQSHFLAALDELELSEPIHSTAVCSGCYACPIVGRIYRCRTCVEKHYCEQCFGGLVDASAQRTDLCLMHEHSYDLFDERGQLVVKALSLAALIAKRSAARTAAGSNQRTVKPITSWKQCVAAVRVSSNEENAHRLHDGRGAFWQTTSSPPPASPSPTQAPTSPFGRSGSASMELININPQPACTHWIELELKPSLLVKRLFLRLNPLDQRYLPSAIRVSVFNEPQNMLHLYPAYGATAASTSANASAAAAPTTKERVLLLTDMTHAYRFVRIIFTKSPEPSKSGSSLQSNVRIHGLELECLPLPDKSSSTFTAPPESSVSAAAAALEEQRRDCIHTKRLRFEFESSEYEASDEERSVDALSIEAMTGTSSRASAAPPPDKSIVFVWGLNDKAQCIGADSEATSVTQGLYSFSYQLLDILTVFFQLPVIRHTYSLNR